MSRSKENVTAPVNLEWLNAITDNWEGEISPFNVPIPESIFITLQIVMFAKNKSSDDFLICKDKLIKAGFDIQRFVISGGVASFRVRRDAVNIVKMSEAIGSHAKIRAPKGFDLSRICFNADIGNDDVRRKIFTVLDDSYVGSFVDSSGESSFTVAFYKHFPVGLFRFKSLFMRFLGKAIVEKGILCDTCRIRGHFKDNCWIHKMKGCDTSTRINELRTVVKFNCPWLLDIGYRSSNIPDDKDNNAVGGSGSHDEKNSDFIGSELGPQPVVSSDATCSADKISSSVPASSSSSNYPAQSSGAPSGKRPTSSASTNTAPRRSNPSSHPRASSSHGSAHPPKPSGSVTSRSSGLSSHTGKPSSSLTSSHSSAPLTKGSTSHSANSANRPNPPKTSTSRSASSSSPTSGTPAVPSSAGSSAPSSVSVSSSSSVVFVFVDGQSCDIDTIARRLTSSQIDLLRKVQMNSLFSDGDVGKVSNFMRELDLLLASNDSHDFLNNCKVLLEELTRRLNSGEFKCL